MQFLFDKLVARPDSLAAHGEEALRKAILYQLDWLVGCREWLAEQQGTGLLDISMPDPLSLPAGGPLMQHYAERLRKLIELHEPRLIGVKVELLPTKQARHPFRIGVIAMLRDQPEGPELRFERDGGG